MHPQGGNTASCGYWGRQASCLARCAPIGCAAKHRLLCVFGRLSVRLRYCCCTVVACRYDRSAQKNTPQQSPLLFAHRQRYPCHGGEPDVYSLTLSLSILLCLSTLTSVLNAVVGAAGAQSLVLVSNLVDPLGRIKRDPRDMFDVMLPLLRTRRGSSEVSARLLLQRSSLV